MGCGTEIVRLLVFAINLLFALAGLALIVLGVLYKLNLNDYTKAIPDDYQNIGLAPILTIAIGCIIFLIAFFGCCGAIRESTCLLTTYAVILIVIFLCQVALGVFAFLAIKDEKVFNEKVEGSINSVFNGYVKNETVELVNLIQTEFQCCGTTDPSYWTKQMMTPPASCYRDSQMNKDGCVKVFSNFLRTSAHVIGITVLALSALEVLSAVFSLCLSNSIKNRERRFRY